MDKNSLTITEYLTLKKEYAKKDIPLIQPVTEVPAGLYEGQFQSQEKDGKKSPVIRIIDYFHPVTQKPLAFAVAKADLTEEKTSKSYNGIGIAITEQMEEYLSVPSNLTKEQMFRSKKGRVRTFVQLAEE